MSNEHSKECCHSQKLEDLCDGCKRDYEQYLDDMYMSEHDMQIMAMDDFLNKLETEGIYYGNQG